MVEKINSHSNGKYIKKQGVKLSKKFIASYVINKVIQVAVFLIVLFGLSYFGYNYFSKPYYKISEHKEVLLKDKEPLLNDTVAFTENKNLIDEILTQVKVKNIQVEKIVGIPFSIVENGEKNIQLKQNEYLVKNEKGDRTIINKKDIYGVVTVIKTNKNK